MESLFEILQVISLNPVTDQRTIARESGISVGKVNALLKTAEEEGYLTIGRAGKKSKLDLTDRGRLLLEETILTRSGKKLTFPTVGSADTAVILAGGKRAGFEAPVCLQPIGDSSQTILDRMLSILGGCGITKFIVIAGWQAELLEKRLSGRADVKVIANERYKWNGTMSGLALAADTLKEWGSASFLVLKSDLVFEERAITALIESDAPFAALLTAPGGGTDEILAELDEQGNIFRFSKDIRQMGRVQGEMTGIAKLSFESFERMLTYHRQNRNPLVGFEYVMENIGRLYRFRPVMVDDLCWGRIQSPEDYKELHRLTYPRIERKEREMREMLAAETIRQILPEETVTVIRFAGGLTNMNYFVETDKGRYILRLPGRMTESMISRKSEKRNAGIASDRGYNCRLIYCNEETGIKLSEYIDNAETFTPRTAKLEENIALTAAILHDLHTSDIVWENRFDGFDESTRYEELLGDASRMYDGFTSLKRKVYALLRPRLYELGYEQKPCHNDLVAANLVKNSLTGRLYLIDWEYAGTNDPMFDVAALFLENEFSPEDEELFFRYYFGEQPTDAVREKILIFKILQDYLWSIWTVLKESRGDDFGSYGIDRFTRAQRNAALWESRF